MPFEFLGRGKVRPRRTRFAYHDWAGRLLDRDAACFGHQAEPDLAAAGQLDIDLREKLGIEQGAVLNPVAAIDPEADTQSVEATLGAGMPGAREGQGVDHPVHSDRRPPAALELVVEEAEIEPGIMGD